MFVLGDVSFGSKNQTVECVSQLRGHKVLIMGNHDRARSVGFWQSAGFDIVSPYPILYKNKYLLMHEPPDDLDMPSPYFYVFGHVHGDPAYKNHAPNSSCVSIERLGFKPTLFEDAVSGAAYLNEI